MVTKDQIESHGLKLDEYKKIKELLGRDANLLELGIFSAMWNEHCSYKSSKIHLKKLPTKNNIVISLIKGKWIGKYTLDKQQNLENNIEYYNKFKQDYMILDKPNPLLKIILFAGPETSIHEC